MIAEIEAALVERVRALASHFGVRVEPFPEGLDGYAMAHPVGAVLVVNKSSRYGPPETTGRHVQKRTLAFELVVLVRGLRGPYGAYPILDALAAGLAGWKHAFSVSGARLVEERFASHDASVWAWSVTVETDAYLVAKPPPPRPGEGAPIRGFTVMAEGGGTTVVGGGDGQV